VTAAHVVGRIPSDAANNPSIGNGDGEPLIYWLVGDDYSQVTEEFHGIEEHLISQWGETLVHASKRVDPGFIEVKIPGHRFPIIRLETKSGRDPSKISRVRPQGIVLCEAGQIDPMIFDRCYGRTIQGGGWILIVGTLEGSIGWFPQLAQAWSSGFGKTTRFKLPAWTNTHLYPGGRQDPKILELERVQSDEYFMERIAGEVVPPKGLVISEFRADIHVRDVKFDPAHPVHLWEDPGYGLGSAHALEVAQNIDGQIRIFDEIYDRGLLTNDVIAIAQKRPWWKAKKYLVSDPHYKNQHHSVHSVHEVWEKEAGLIAGGEPVREGPGRERIKTFLKVDPLTGHPGLVIAPHCQGVLSEAGAAVDPFDNQSYHPWRWKVDRYGNVIGDTPEDKYNHAWKAISYGLIYNFGYTEAQQRRVVKVTYRGR